MSRPRPLADLLGACLTPTLRAQGFATADILVAWPEIVGERLSAHSQPLKVEWPRRRLSFGSGGDGPPLPATLVVRVEGAFALEMQHVAPLVVERVNAHYGWRCVGRLVLKQGPMRRPAVRPRPAQPLTVAERDRVAGALEGVVEDRLRAALDRLGSSVIAARPRPPAE